jgi:hypothetical protein
MIVPRIGVRDVDRATHEHGVHAFGNNHISRCDKRRAKYPFVST